MIRTIGIVLWALCSIHSVSIAQEYDEDGFNVIEPKLITIKCDDGCEYVGESYDGVPHGKGKYSWPDGYSYEGEFIYGEFHGKGEVKSNDNCYRFFGDFYNGSAHGQGTIEIDGKAIYRGKWDLDKIVGEGICECHDITFECRLPVFLEQCVNTSREANLVSEECAQTVENYIGHLEYWRKEP